jgi:hypothetical protein
MLTPATLQIGWARKPGGFESLRSLRLRLSFRKHATVAPIVGLQRDRGFYLTKARKPMELPYYLQWILQWARVESALDRR